MTTPGRTSDLGCDRATDLDQARADQAFGRAITAGDIDEAIGLILANGQRMMRGGHSQVLVDWLAQLPGDALLRSSELTLTLGQACALVGDTVTATAVLRSLRDSIGPADRRAPQSVLVGLAHLEADVYLLTGDLNRIRNPILELGDLTRLGEGEAAAGWIDWPAVHASLALGHLFAGDLADAIVAAERLLVLDNIVPPSRAVVSALGTRSLAHAWSADDGGARRAVRDGMPVVDRFMGAGAEPVYLHVAALWIAEDGDAPRSEEFATERARTSGYPALRLATALATARSSMRSGQLRRATDSLADADRAMADMVDPAFLGTLRRQLDEELEAMSTVSPTRELTTPEVNCLVAISRGLTRPEVAAELDYTLNTVKTHLRHAYHKLGATDRDDAIAKATTHGVLPAERR